MCFVFNVCMYIVLVCSCMHTYVCTSGWPWVVENVLKYWLLVPIHSNHIYKMIVVYYVPIDHSVWTQP